MGIAVIILIIILLLLARNIRIVPQAQAMVVERLGRIQRNLECGTAFQGSDSGPCSKESDFKGAGSRFPATAGNHQG